MNKRVQQLVGVAMFVTLATALVVSSRWGRSQEPGGGFRGLTPTEREALRRRVEQSIHERGVVESASVIELRNQVPGERVLMSVVPDGSRVQEGDLLIRLDDSDLRQQLAQQQVDVKQAESAVAAAAAALASAKRRSAFDVPAARLNVRVAELARSRFLGEGGELEVRQAKAERDVVLAEQRLELAERRLSDTEANDGDRPAEELQLAVDEARADLATAEATRNLVNSHVRIHQAAVLDLALSQAQAALQRGEAEADAAVQAAEAELQSRQTVLELAKHRFAEIERHMASCRILAPRDGVVVHAVPTTRRAGTSILESGAVVREQQRLLTMPDLVQLRVRVTVHESQIDRVRTGQTVTLRIDAFPEREFPGDVVQISRTPEPTQWYAQDAVEYSVLVAIQSPPPGLKLGMTAVAEIQTGPRGRH